MAFIDRQEVRGSARARHAWGRHGSASGAGFYFFFLLNTEPSEERGPAVTQSWGAGLRNVLQEYPDPASPGPPPPQPLSC